LPRRSKTPGVKLIHRKAHGRLSWRGRWLDPYEQKWRELVLDTVGITTAIERQRWAEAKAEEIAAGRRTQALGQAQKITIRDAVKAYLADCKARRLREGTRSAYEEALTGFADWMEARGRWFARDLAPADLWAYRTSAVRADAKASTVTTHLSRLKTALAWWRRARYLPRVTAEDLDEACKALPREQPLLSFLRADACRLLLGHLADPAACKPKHPEAIAFIAAALLTGMRLGELEQLRWEQVDLKAKPSGEIRLGVETKIRRGRIVDLAVSTALQELLAALPRRGPYVWFGDRPASRDVNRYWKDLRPDEGMTPWTWQDLRQTCGTFLANAPGIFGAASAYRAARQLGHSVAVAEKHYLGVVRGIPESAKTLEAAMSAEAEATAVVGRVKRWAATVPRAS
jgi:integrase